MRLRNYEPLIDWDCHELPSNPGFYLENSRQLFENPRGDEMEAALDRGCHYRLVSDNEVHDVIIHYSHEDTRHFSPEVSILKFISSYTEPRSREEVIHCCSNRLKMLLKKGHNLNGKGVFGVIQFSPEDRLAIYHSTVNYATSTGVWKDLKEMLVQIGWNEREIQELYDEEILIGVSTLMEVLQYHTIKNAREEFLQRLLDVDDYSCFYSEELPIELATLPWFISDAITHACLQWPEKIDIPGSWPEEQVVMESISEKDLIMPWCLNFYSLTVTHSRYYTCIHYG